MAIDHTARARRAWPVLARLAASGAPAISYKQLTSPLGLHYRAAGRFLSVIQIWCKANGKPPLQALAVNGKTKLPGTGYTGSARSKAVHKRTLARVRRVPWPMIAPF